MVIYDSVSRLDLVRSLFWIWPDTLLEYRWRSRPERFMGDHSFYEIFNP